MSFGRRGSKLMRDQGPVGLRRSWVLKLECAPDCLGLRAVLRPNPAEVRSALPAASRSPTPQGRANGRSELAT